MHGPPDAEMAAPDEKAATQFPTGSQTTTAEEIDEPESESNTLDCWRQIGDVLRESITGALIHVSLEHAGRDSVKLRARLASLADLNKLMVWAARVHFDGDRWEPDVAGRWAIVAAFCHEGEKEISDLVAFDAEGPAVATLTGAAWCLGVNVLYDALHFNDGRIRVCANIWSYVRDQGQSMLILDWKRAVLTFMERGVRGVITSDVLEGRRIKQRLEHAYRAPEIFVDEKERRA